MDDDPGNRTSFRMAFLRAATEVSARIFLTFFLIWLVLTIGSLGYFGIRYSSENFPVFLHIPVLALSAGLVLSGVTILSSSALREQHHDRLLDWFGPYALVVLPVMILIVAIAVFSSVTHLLNGLWPGLLIEPDGLDVSEGRIADFYLWHFCDLIPFLDVPGTLRWEPPLDYSSGWTGLLVLLFQAAVVLPSIQVIRLYFRKER